MPRSRLRILVAGRLASGRQGGAAWAVLQWLLGLRSLGHDVLFLEHAAGSKGWRPQARYLREVTTRFGLAEHTGLFLPGGGIVGASTRPELLTEAATCDLLVDMSGVLSGHEMTAGIPVRLYVDLDPGFTQLWHRTGVDMGLQGHTHFATVGQQIGQAGHAIPDCGFEWIHVLPPVFLDAWPVLPRRRSGRFTTVANWRSYGSITHEGVFHGQKAHSFRAFADLPSLTDTPLAVALAISPEERADLERLRAGGWQVLDAARVASSPGSYQRFVQRSAGEIGIAKSGYVVGRTGWFSDRSAAYLASGRPVVAQDTGLEPFLPTDAGLLVFDDLPGAAERLDHVRRDYARHALAARRIAEEHLDARRVLGTLLRTLGMA